MTTSLEPKVSRSLTDPLDWSRLLSAHEVWVRGVIFARTGEAQAVDEVWQEVALAAVEQRAPLADPAKAPGWLYRVAAVLSIRHRRQQARRRQRLARLAAEPNGRPSTGDDPAEWLLRKERRQTPALKIFAGFGERVAPIECGAGYGIMSSNEP